MVKFTSIEALKLLEDVRSNGRNVHFIDHSICVGNTAGVIAKALNLDEDYAKTLGYIHDIGKKFNYGKNEVFAHEVYGYNYIKSLGYGDEYAGICVKHSFLNNDVECTSSDREEIDRTSPNYEFVKKLYKKRIFYI